MNESAADFKARLIRRTGLSESAITAAWPDWWSEAAEASPAAQAELRFSLARKLGLDARSLLGEDQPRFIWNDSTRSEEYTSELQSLMRISYAVFCLKNKTDMSSIECKTTYTD